MAGLLDTEPDAADLLDLDDDNPNESMMSTAVELDPTDREVQELLMDAPLEDEGIGAEDGVVEDGGPVPAAVEPTRKRRQKVGDGPRRSRKEIAQAAANARWAKKRRAAAEAASAVPDPEPVAPAQLQMVLHESCSTGTSADCLAVMAEPLAFDTKSTAEKQIFEKTRHLVSVTSVADTMQVSRKFVKERMRLMAAIMYYGCRYRYWLFLRNLIEHVKASGADYKSVQDVVKQRYDEFQCFVKVSTVPEGMPDGWIVGKGEGVKAKLLQITTFHAAVLRINGRHVLVEGSTPSMTRPIESTHAECLQDALEAEAPHNGWAANEFEGHTRMSIVDNAPSNALAEFSLFQKYAQYVILRWLCLVHRGHKISELQWSAFPGDLRGIMSLTMAFQLQAFWSKFKSGMQKWYEHMLEWHPFGSEPLDADAQRHADNVFQSFSHTDDLRLTGPKARARQKVNLSRRTVYTGDLRRADKIEHRCLFRGCCASRADSIKKHADHLELEEPPKVWSENRWLGSEDALDFAAWWLNLNFLLIAGILIGWFKLTIAKVISLMQAWSSAPEVNIDMSFNGGSFEETTKEMTDNERQTTYRANVELWLKTLPLPRLWVLKRLVRLQQGHQKQLLRISGKAFELEQMRNVQQGIRRKFRPVMAYDQELTGPTLVEYAKLLTEESQWQFLPEAYCIHSIAMTGFRSVSRSICALVQLEGIPNSSYPAKYFATLKPGGEVVAAASAIVGDLAEAPCIFDPWSYQQACKYDTIGLQTGAENLAVNWVTAVMSELDNAVTEANNASLRRRIKMHLQQKVPSFTDTQADWIYKWSRLERDSIWESSDEDASSADSEEEEACPPTGGRYRAFISKNKGDFKPAHMRGKVDFSMAKAAFDELLRQDPEGQELKDLHGSGRIATKAGRVHHEAGVRRSSFGTVRPRDVEHQRAITDQDVLLQDFDARMAASQGVLEHHGQELAIMDTSPETVLSDIVLASAGTDLKDQLVTLDGLCRAKLRRDKENDTEVALRLTKALSSGEEFCGVSLKGMPLPEMAKIKVLQDEMPWLHLCDPAQKFAQQKAAELSQHPQNIGGKLREQFEKQCAMKLRQDCEPPLRVGDGFRPTYCYKHGAGGCICKGDGILHDVFRRKLVNMLLLMCRPDTIHRHLLVNGWLFVRLGSSLWYHIGMMYLNPQRGTFVQVYETMALEDGMFDLTCRCPGGLPEVFQDVQIARSIDLGQPLHIRLFKLVSMEAHMHPFVLGTKLTVQPLDSHLFMACNDARFWFGRDKENLDEWNRRAKKAAKAAADRRKAAAKAGVAPAPAASPPRRNRRAVQRPAGAGMVAPPGAAMVALPLADSVPAAPAPASHLFAEGDVEESLDADRDGELYRHGLPGGAGLEEDWRAALQRRDAAGAAAGPSSGGAAEATTKTTTETISRAHLSSFSLG